VVEVVGGFMRPVYKAHVTRCPLNTMFLPDLYIIFLSMIIEETVTQKEWKKMEYYNGHLATSCNLKIEGQNDTFLMT
jgi:hypothetical protein